LWLRPLDCRGEACKVDHNEKGEVVEERVQYLSAKTRLPASETERLLGRFKRMTTMRKKQVSKKMSLKREKLAYLYLRRPDR
jgi:hypothetical protein